MKGSRRVGQGTTLPPLQEENLARWVMSMRRDGVPVTEKMLQFMALEAAIDVGLSEDEFRCWLELVERIQETSWPGHEIAHTSRPRQQPGRFRSFGALLSASERSDARTQHRHCLQCGSNRSQL
ncbi:unnamed protein product [Aphanomyces euteiches]